MNPFAKEVAFHSYDRDFVVSAAYLFYMYLFWIIYVNIPI